MKRVLASSLLLFACAACTRSGARLQGFEGATMGTTYAVQIVASRDALNARVLHARVDALLCAIEGRMSTYDPTSELSRFNASDSTAWFPVSSDTLMVVEAAQRVSRLSGGAFDVTVGPLVELWGFGPQEEHAVPAPEAIASTLERVGFRMLETRASPPALRKLVPDLSVDLSAIAKGYAVDAVAHLLEAAGALDYLVEVGGELRARGRNAQDAPWRVAIERPPPAERAPACVLRLAGRAVATSGDSHRVFVEDGVRYTHVIDPRTGRPVTTMVASATVLSTSAMEADAFATALMVLAPDEGLRLASKAGLDARLLLRTGDRFAEHETPWFGQYVP